jgi:hypothetical protein
MTPDAVRSAIMDAFGAFLLLEGVAAIMVGLILIALGRSPERWK